MRQTGNVLKKSAPQDCPGRHPDGDNATAIIPVRNAFLKILASKIASHPIVGKTIAWLYKDVIPFHGGRIDLRGLDVPAKNKALLFWGIYESAEYRFVRDYLSPALPVIELGSSLGAIASVIVRRLQQDQRLICVEANPRLLNAIRKTLARNAPNLRSEVINAAICYESAFADFRVTEDNLCSSVNCVNSTCVVRVPCVTLAELVARLGDCEYQLVADIEGAEASLLLYEQDVLARCRTAVLELHPTEHNGQKITPDDMVSTLQTIGFTDVVRYGAVVACRR